MLPEYAERARKNERLVINRVERIGGDEVGRRMGVSDSTVSRLKNGERAQWCGFLAALGLKIVPVEFACYDAKRIGAVLELAKAHLASLAGPHELAWDDDPPDG